jgi:hypothetical protein
VDDAIIRRTLIDTMRRQGLSPEQAAQEIARGFGIEVDHMAGVLDQIAREAERNFVLDSPPGVFASAADLEAKVKPWYSGPHDGDSSWPQLKAMLESGGLSSVVDEIDQASTKVVSHLACPWIQNLSKRGLVLGYVQSGKTANYTAVMAKAADAGYRLFIVLSGMYNNLRRQTQVRLANDLGEELWYKWTSADADFGGAENGAPILNGRVPSLAVVKKNQARLIALIKWLDAIPLEVRKRSPILLLDDEADQATPNSAKAQDQLTRINQLVRELWSKIPTGTYVGYTATPFANIFMDPTDEEELYPADFIIDLPRPSAYYGAERVFGREPLDDADDPDPGLDVVRKVSDDEANSLRAPSNQSERLTFDPDLPESLIQAVTWFVVATSIRHVRNQQDKHSSMLVHTTHYVRPHFTMKARLDELLQEFKTRASSGDNAVFLASYQKEATRIASEATAPLPSWGEVETKLETVLATTRVVVDNGYSEDRLDYGRIDENGEPTVETVIAVGGGTLSRGLTLEGLVVSYFTRTSNTYDTLLQMGRWFGYRPGYEDLQRIWMQTSLGEEFKFLALVEEEIRQDIRHMERMKVTPRQLGVRVRAHPGRLAIVARNRMRHADAVKISFSGQRLQTFIFDEDNKVHAGFPNGVLTENLASVRKFLDECRILSREDVHETPARRLIKGVPGKAVTTLLRAYIFHEDQSNMRKGDMAGWIESAAQDRLWNVVVIGSNKNHRDMEGQVIPLGDTDLGFKTAVPNVNRAPLQNPESFTGTANIKALMSHMDWFADLDPAIIRALDDGEKYDPRGVRRQYADGRGLIAIYPVSKDSVPMGAIAIRTGARRRMEADENLIGLGVIFPDVDREGFAAEGTYYSVHPDWEPSAADDDDDEIPEDTEPIGDSPPSGQDSGPS